VFLAFVKLDKQYLQTLSIAMQHTALRMQEGQAQAALRDVSKYILNCEVKLFEKYTKPSFYLPEPTPHSLHALHAYTHYLLHTASQCPIEVGIAAYRPCFEVYRALGLHMQALARPTNPYLSWINSYSGQRFSVATQQITHLYDTMLLASPELCQQMEAAVLQSTRFELGLWDSVCTARCDKPKTPML
jgi:thiaminase/transcriptional activator TenA